jgi:hypothetical protein
MCQIVFGCQDGKVRLANLKSAKSVALYSTGSYVVSVSPRCDLEPREGGGRGCWWLSPHDAITRV